VQADIQPWPGLNSVLIILFYPPAGG